MQSKLIEKIIALLIPCFALCFYPITCFCARLNSIETTFNNIYKTSKTSNDSELLENNEDEINETALYSTGSHDSSIKVIKRHMIETNTTIDENFHPYSYFKKQSLLEETTIDLSSDQGTFSFEEAVNNSVCLNETLEPSDTNIELNSLIGTDERTKVQNTTIWPYKGVALVLSVYYNVYDNYDQEYTKVTCRGTGFMVGPNILATAGHCLYGDPSSNSARYEDNIDNPRFPNEVYIYAGYSSNLNPSNINISNYAEGLRINIQKEYYDSRDTNYDWGVLELDRNLGVTTNYFNIIGNWYQTNHDALSFGYPGDKDFYMYETQGKVMSSTEFKYYYNFDTMPGQSGSPILIYYNSILYVCGIHTNGTTIFQANNSGTRFNSLIFHYIQSFLRTDANSLFLSINEKSGSTWKISAYNALNEVMTIQYNKKMCFSDDAKYWTNLNDVANKNIHSKNSTIVEINENWFATTIAFSYIKDNKRYITYADNLNSQSKSMKIYRYRIYL